MLATFWSVRSWCGERDLIRALLVWRWWDPGWCLMIAREECGCWNIQLPWLMLGLVSIIITRHCCSPRCHARKHKRKHVSNNQHLPNQKQISVSSHTTQVKFQHKVPSSWGHNLFILKCLTGCWGSDNNSSNLHLIEVLKSGLSLHQWLIRWELDSVWRMCGGDVTTPSQGPA